MSNNIFLNFKVLIIVSLVLVSCAHSTLNPSSSDNGIRCPAQTTEAVNFYLVPQENYGEEVLRLIKEKGKDGLFIMHFNFFTDNREESYPKRIAGAIETLKKENPTGLITIALESQKDANEPKGIAARNALTKQRFSQSGISVYDIHGQSLALQTPPGKEDGVSHAKLIIVGDTIIAGSSNLTKQSTDPGANNEMNMSIQSQNISNTLRDYVNKIIQKPGEMVDVSVEDGPVKVLTDRLHFKELIAQIKSAQAGDVIGLSMYQFLYRDERDVQAKEVFEELLAAKNRGASLEIFLNRAMDLKTQNSEANLRVAELFLQNDIGKVYFDSENKISHSKFFYRIGKNEKVSMISSVNIYRGDFNDNHQITMVIKDGLLTDKLSEYFRQQVAYDGTLVSRIPIDPATQKRYSAEVSIDKKTSVWNQPLPAKPMVRFWRGFKQEEDRTQFEKNVNESLIPRTVEVGGGRGLRAYLPSFYSDNNKQPFIPDEIAIVSYNDAESYNAIRSTTEGKQYGALHFEKGFFAQANSQGLKSGSVVGVEYAGKVEIKSEGNAYIFGEADINWQSGIAVRRTLLPRQDLTPQLVQNYLNDFKSHMSKWGISGGVVLVDPKYLILMISVQNVEKVALLDNVLSSIETEMLSKLDHITFNNQKYKSTNLAPGTGINVLFDTTLKPRSEIFLTILNNLKPQFKMVAGRCERILQ